MNSSLFASKIQLCFSFISSVFASICWQQQNYTATLTICSLFKQPSTFSSKKSIIGHTTINFVDKSQSAK